MFHRVRSAFARPRHTTVIGTVDDSVPVALGRVVVTRRRAVAVLVTMVALWSLVAASPALFVSARHNDLSGLDQFLWGLGVEESGRDYYARNDSSGAYGKYQIMPENWAGWSQRFLGQRQPDQNPLNQELVARAKISALHGWLGTWRRVAYWWLTGDTERDSAQWTEHAQRYVDNVLALRDRAPKAGDPLPEATASIDGIPVERGDWRVVSRPANLYDQPGKVHERLRALREGLKVPVRRAEWGPLHFVIWLKVQAPDGTLGWVQMRQTVPARTPHANAE